MKFLSKVAEYIQKGLQILNLFQPVVQAENQKAGQVVTTVSKDLSEVFGAVQDAEQIGQAMNLPGAGKLQVAIPLIGDIVLQSAALSGHTIANQALYNQGLAKFSDGAADIVNSLDPKGVVAVSKAS